MDALQIIDYQPCFAGDFKRLNLAWIRTYFHVEPHDLEQLDHPQEHILDGGGHILLARIGGAIVGAVALVRVDGATLELAKMAVDETRRGQGIGERLCRAALDKARQVGATQVFLESNRKLAPALALYEKMGFREVPALPTPYSRADIRMALPLD